MTDREAIECMEYLNEHQHSTLFKSLVSSEQREIISEGIRLSISAIQEREERSKECEGCLHGRWEDKPTGRYGQWQSWCSACGKHSGIGGIKSNRHKPFCPNCGAKMDGDTE